MASPKTKTRGSVSNAIRRKASRLTPSGTRHGPTVRKQLSSDILQRLGAAHAGAVKARAEIGRLLLQIKSSLKHGEWLPWLAANMPFTPATAKRAIRLHLFQKAQPAAFEKLCPLGLTKAYRLMALPAAERDAFVAQTHVVASTGARKTPLAMTMDELMEVLHPPEPVTKAGLFARALRGFRRQVRALGRLVTELGAMLPAIRKRPALKAALVNLALEVEAVSVMPQTKSLIGTT